MKRESKDIKKKKWKKRAREQLEATKDSKQQHQRSTTCFGLLLVFFSTFTSIFPSFLLVFAAPT